MLRTKNFIKRLKPGSLALLFLLTQASFALTPFINVQSALAANEITVSDHEGQLKPEGTYSNGDIKSYKELETINFRFTIDSSATAEGRMQIEFSGVETVGQACTFFQQTFSMGTHDSSAGAVVAVSGAAPTVTTVGNPTADGDEWIQVLDVDFAAAGTAVINYYLTLTDEAGDCGGSSQHTRLGNVTGPAGGNFANIGAQNVPIPAKDVIELASITVIKYVDDNGDGVTERTATAGEWTFSLNNGTPVATNASGQVVFSGLNTGSYTISESGPAGYSFLGVRGTNCVVGQISGTAVATVTAASTAVDASCTFSNGVAPGKIKIIKNAVRNNLDDFAFTATGAGVSGFTLDDDSNVTGADNTYSNVKEFTGLTTGEYTFTESPVSGWDLEDISCTGSGAVTDEANRKVTITLTAGGDVTCTFENRQHGQIIVTKQTLPDGDQTQFPVTITGDNTIHNPITQNVTDDNSVTFNVSHGTYYVNENEPGGWSADESDCQGLVVNGTTPLVNGIPTVTCTITNTKLATLTIIKNAIPNHAENFEFSVTNLLGGNFFLDDDEGAIDEDTDYTTQKIFNNLTPGTSYSVTELPTPGWSLTDLSCDNVKQVGSTATVTPTPGQNLTCTFINTKLVSISGTKYEVNDGATDGTGGTVLNGWIIFNDANSNGIVDDGELSDTTDASGNYTLNNILYGTNIVLREILIAGWTQIFGNTEFTIDSAEDITGQDFGNFENATISGFKWNDKNGNATHQSETEEKLAGWTITLYNDGDDEDTELDDVVDTDVTDQDGNYSFTNLEPGVYAICETPQTGWTQTFPADNGCHIVTIDVSGETENANFGNQGRGSIRVNKNVDVNGDGNLDDTEDVTGATDWTWDLGDENFSTGSTQQVAADNYTITEDQKDNYHFTSVVCTRNNEAFTVTQDESVDVTVNPGDTIVCTFVNTRDTGSITIIKDAQPDSTQEFKFTGNLGDPSDDEPNFTLVDDGGDNDNNRRTFDTVTTGTYTVTEPNVKGWDLTDISCVGSNGTDVNVNQRNVVITLAADEDIECTFINVQRGQIIIEKDAIPADGTDFDFSIAREIEDIRALAMTMVTTPTLDDGYGQFKLDDADKDDDDDVTNQQALSLAPGTYYITEENLPDSWRLTDIYCGENTQYDTDDNVLTLYVSRGENIHCYFVNEKDAEVTVTKFNDTNRNGEFDEETEEVLADWQMNLSAAVDCDISETVTEASISRQVRCEDYNYSESQNTEITGSTTFNAVKPSVAHTLSETMSEAQVANNWNFSNLYCEGKEAVLNEDELTFSTSAGEAVDCYVGNYQDVVLNLEKRVSTPTASIGDTVTYTLIVSVPEDSGTSYNTTVTDLPPEGFTYVPGSAQAEQGSLTKEYASPGIWSVGTINPGDSVTLTYQAYIEDSVAAGTYPDLAFALGCEFPDAEMCDVYSNVREDGNQDPFVNTAVSVDAPRVLGASITRTILVDTGDSRTIMASIIAVLLLTSTLFASRRKYPLKGGVK